MRYTNLTWRCEFSSRIKDDIELITTENSAGIATPIPSFSQGVIHSRSLLADGVNSHLQVRSVYIKFTSILMAASLLSGCVSLSLQQPAQKTFQNQPALVRQQALYRLTNWNISGAFSLQEQAKKSVIAAYTWQQQNNHYRIQISSSLNLEGAIISGQPGNVTLQNNRNQRFHAQSPEQLMQQQLGWQLPISNLFYWVRGIPAPGVPAQTNYDQYGHMQQLTQNGFTVQFSRYRSVGNFDLPQQLQITKPGLQAKIVIKSWQLN